MNICKENIGWIGQTTEEIIGIVHLNITMQGVLMPNKVPFAVVRDGSLPCCSIIGSNFLAANGIIVDFSDKVLRNSREQEEFRYPLRTGEHDNFLGTIRQETAIEPSKLEFNINKTEIEMIQDRDPALKTLKNHIRQERKWKEASVKQFRKHYQALKIEDKVLVWKEKAVAVPFKLMIEIVHKIHNKLGHIGTDKLREIATNHFWHPAIDKIVNDIVTSCPHCQIYKVSRITKMPPMHKISAQKPFEMIAVDLLQLPHSRGINVLLVAIDHHSKWASAVPVKDKKGKTVAKALEERIIPNLVRIPNSILSDNGP